MGFVGIAAAGYTVQALLRMHAEEASGRLEPVLATATGRRRWLASHLLVVLAGTVGLLASAGAAAALAFAAVTGRWDAAGGLMGGALAQVPAALALGGLVVAAFALVPRRAPALAWTALAVSLVMGQLGALLQLPQPALNLSPFTHVPAVPAQPLEVLPVAVLLAVAVAATLAGAVAFRRRDLALEA
jgi:ABC-2 type transport system permease protein